MSLFGRKKPGFVQFEPESPAEESAAVPTEQSAGTVSDTSEEKAPELFELLESLPDVEDPYADTEAAREQAEAEAEQAAQPEEPPTDSQILAGYIRERSAGAALTPYAAMAAEIEQTDELLAGMQGDPKCADIVFVQGAKDKYYYSNANMTDNYAMIISLVEEKDYPYTIARMVRWNCVTYPAVTPLSYFEKHPYYMTRPQIDRALDVIFREEQYSDIHKIINNDNVEFLYSSNHMTDKYARGLAHHEEFTD